MSKLNEKSYLLENLGCANCAAKMEIKLNKLDEINSASINFVKKKLVLELDKNQNGEVSEDLFAKIKKAVTSIESGVIVTPLDGNKNDSSIDSNDNTSDTYLDKDSKCTDGCCSGHSHGENISSHMEHSHDHKECDFQHKDHAECGNHQHKSSHHDNCQCNTHEQSHKSSIENSHAHQHTHEHSHGTNNPRDKKTILLEISKLVLGLIISFSGILFDLPNPFGIILIIIGYAILGSNVLLKSFNGIRHGEIFDENFLVVIATIGAIIIGEYPEGIMVMLLFQIGEFLQDLAVDNSRKQLEAAMNIKPEYANIQTESGIKTVAPESVHIDDVIVVKPSEKIPLDGVVIDGSSFVDTSSLTGESVPRKMSPGDQVLSGCINGSGTLFIKVEKSYSNSTVAKVLDLVENASSRKSNTENFITKFARIYTPIVVLCAVLLSVIPPIITGSYDFSTWVYKACGFLVVSCPCALVISVPLGFFGGIGAASKNGILVKGSNYLEALNSIETAVFDKTGTLTKGVFTVSDIHTSVDITEDALLEIAATLESFSTHPIAKSIVAAYQKPIDTSMVSNYEEIAGLGIKASLDNKTILIGNGKLLDTNNISYEKVSKDTHGTITYLAINNIYAGYIIISDEIKEDTKTGLKALKSLGINTVMLTGDTKSTAQVVAKEIDIDSVYAELLPTDKVEKIEEILDKKSSNKNVLFVGDGINDAPVLARADVGIAMGGVGSDAAIEAADIVLMTDEPSKIALAIKIAKNTRKIVTENIILSLGIKAIVLILLAIGYGSMWLAIFADGGVALIAIFNSIRALKFKR